MRCYVWTSGWVEEAGKRIEIPYGCGRGMCGCTGCIDVFIHHLISIVSSYFIYSCIIY